MKITVGDFFTRQEIHEMYGGEIQSYLPQKNGQIACGCFTQRFNPDSPVEIQVGNHPKVIKKAKLLAAQKSSIPVFIKDPARIGKSERIWRYCGRFKFDSLVDDRNLVQAAEKKSGRLGELVFLLRLRQE
jgi:hypothetical protein